MTAITGSFEEALDESSRVLAVRGRVLPSTLMQVNLAADVVVPRPASDDGGSERVPTGEERWQRIQGESRIGAVRGQVQRLYLEPDEVAAYPGAIRAILGADLIIAGPGSLYTSVLPNLLVPELAQAIASSPAPKVYVCNVATQAGETEGYDVAAHLTALRRHVNPDLFRIVLANNAFGGPKPPGEGVDWVRLPEQALASCRMVARDLVDSQYPWRHDPDKLAQALLEPCERMKADTLTTPCGDFFSTLYRVARAVNSSLDIMQVLDMIVRSTAEALDAKACTLRLLDPAGQRLFIGAVYGLRPTYRAKGRWMLRTARWIVSRWPAASRSRSRCADRCALSVWRAGQKRGHRLGDRRPAGGAGPAARRAACVQRRGARFLALRDRATRSDRQPQRTGNRKRTALRTTEP